MRSPLALAVALAATASLGSMGQSAEVVPRPEGLGGWVTRNNKRPRSKSAPKAKQPQRLQRASGVGSYDEWKKALAAERVARRASVNGDGKHA